MTAGRAGAEAVDLELDVRQGGGQLRLGRRVPELDGQEHAHVQGALFLQQGVQGDGPVFGEVFGLGQLP